ncbi:hypothetical protein D9M71_570590 [compost metagenome]
MVRAAHQFFTAETADLDEVVIGVGDYTGEISGGKDIGVTGIIHIATGHRQIALHRRHSLLLGESAGRTTLVTNWPDLLIQLRIIGNWPLPSPTSCPRCQLAVTLLT